MIGFKKFIPYRPKTNFDRIAASPEALAAWIIESQKHDLYCLWCHDDHGCADLDEDFDCTDELQARCIVDWLNSARMDDEKSRV